MAGKKISEATTTAPLVGTDMIPFARSADETPRHVTVLGLFGAIPVDIILDDGAGNSPSLKFVGGSNDDVAIIFLGDNASSELSDLYILLPGDSVGAQLKIQDVAGVTQHQFDSKGGVIFNYQGNDADFQVKAVGQSNALFVQGSDGRIGFGTGTLNYSGFPSASYGTITMIGAEQYTIELGSSHADVDNQDVGEIRGIFTTADVGYKDIASILFQVDGSTAGKRGGAIVFYTQADNTNVPVERMRIGQDGIAIHLNDIVLDDGDGDSPRIKFVGGSFDDVAYLWLDDSGSGIGRSDVELTLASDTSQAHFFINNASVATQHSFSAVGAVVHNEQGNDADHRIEAVGQPNALFVQGSGGYVGLGLVPTANMPGLSIEAGLLTLKERALPTADTDYGKIWCESDNTLHFQDGAGTEYIIDITPV